MKKRVFAAAIVLVLALALLPTMAMAKDADVTITTAAELVSFAEKVNGGENFKDKTVVLTADIDLGGIDWTPMWELAGEFDGNGKTVSNFHVVYSDGNRNGGFFRKIAAGGYVHDLTLSDVTATVGGYETSKGEHAGERFGTLANNLTGKAERVTAKNVTVTAVDDAAWVGGMAAWIYYGEASDCTVENLTVNAEDGAYFAAGFTANLQQNSTSYAYKNCKVNGFKLTIDSPSAIVGGFAGQTQSGSCTVQLDTCAVSGMDFTLSGGDITCGGMIGVPGSRLIADNCTSAGSVDASALTDGYVGGFLADLGWNSGAAHEITGCTANVNIVTKTAPAGGFIGSATNQRDNMRNIICEDCEAAGTVVSLGEAAVGGFAGEADRGTYVDCTVSGTVAGKEEQTGAFIGREDDKYKDNENLAIHEENITFGTTITVPEGTDITAGEGGYITIPAGATVTESDGSTHVTTEDTVLLGGSMLDEAGVMGLLFAGLVLGTSQTLGTPLIIH